MQGETLNITVPYAWGLAEVGEKPGNLNLISSAVGSCNSNDKAVIIVRETP